MINKKILIASACIIGSLATTAFAAELSQSTIETCRNYLNNPTEAAGNNKDTAAALEQCEQDNVCDNQLSTVSYCKNNLTDWSADHPAPTKPEPQPVIQSTPVTSPATTTPVAPAEPPAKTETPKTDEFYQPAEQPETQNQTESQPEKQPSQKKEPSINWF